MKHKLPEFIGKVREIVIFNFCLSILKFYIFIYTILCDLFLKEIIFVENINNFKLYKIKDNDINKYYDIISIDDDQIDKMIKEKLKNRNLLFYCSINTIDITEDVRKFINYYDKIEDIPWNYVHQYLLSINKIDACDKQYDILLIDNDFNEININHSI